MTLKSKLQSFWSFVTSSKTVTRLFIAASKLAIGFKAGTPNLIEVVFKDMLEIWPAPNQEALKNGLRYLDLALNEFSKAKF